MNRKSSFKYYLELRGTSERFTYEYTLEEIWSGRFSLRLFDAIARCEYAGKEDIDGVKIYEGDILDVESGPGEVVFHEEYLGFFVAVSEYEQNWKPLYDMPCPKIIGNKYDNPELLERNKNE